MTSAQNYYIKEGRLNFSGFIIQAKKNGGNLNNVRRESTRIHEQRVRITERRN